MPTTFTTLEMYNILREKISDEEAQLLTHYVEQQVEAKRRNNSLSATSNFYKLKIKAESEAKRWKMYV